MTVRETIFLKEVARVIGLMNPQFPGGSISLELNPKVLRYCPHVGDTELHVQLTFRLIKKEALLLPAIPSSTCQANKQQTPSL